jgi:hypothetical protein
VRQSQVRFRDKLANTHPCFRMGGRSWPHRSMCELLTGKPRVARKTDGMLLHHAESVCEVGIKDKIISFEDKETSASSWFHAIGWIEGLDDPR